MMDRPALSGSCGRFIPARRLAQDDGIVRPPRKRGKSGMATGPVGTSEIHHRTWWPGVALGVGVACACAYQQFKLPPILPDLLRAHPHDPAVAAGVMSIYALVGLMVSQPLGSWLQGNGRLGRGLALAGLLTAIGGALA